MIKLLKIIYKIIFVDIRTARTAVGRSINLALSHRGRKALGTVGLEIEILNTGIPMKGRLLHCLSGDAVSVPYDPVTNEVIKKINSLSQKKKFINVSF